MPDWLQSLLTPATIVAAVAFLSMRIERILVVLICKLDAIEETLIHNSPDGMAKAYKENLERALEQRRITRGK